MPYSALLLKEIVELLEVLEFLELPDGGFYGQTLGALLRRYPQGVVASACNVQPYIISKHTLRSDAELQLQWLQRRLTTMHFLLICKEEPCPTYNEQKPHPARN